jgi:hypothetical protein
MDTQRINNRVLTHSMSRTEVLFCKTRAYRDQIMRFQAIHTTMRVLLRKEGANCFENVNWGQGKDSSFNVTS